MNFPACSKAEALISNTCSDTVVFVHTRKRRKTQNFSTLGVIESKVSERSPTVESSKTNIDRHTQVATTT